MTNVDLDCFSIGVFDCGVVRFYPDLGQLVRLESGCDPITRHFAQIALRCLVASSAASLKTDLPVRQLLLK
jgi:hypothetical protein